MKARVKTYVNIRTGSPQILPFNNIDNAYLSPGEIVDIAATVIGDKYKGNDKWYRLEGGGFVWSGSMVSDTIEMQTVLPTAVVRKLLSPQKFDPIKMSWAFAGPDGIDLISFWNEHNLMGQNVTVAVLDSGINTQVLDVFDAVENKQLDCKSFIPNESIQDDLGHGTNCASIIASRGGNLFGVSPACKLVVAKIESKSVGKASAITLAALKWACEERNADIISLSFSFPSISDAPGTPEEKAVADYILKMHNEKNKLFVASIGNLGQNAIDFNAFPANYPGCISIGAFGAGKKIWNGSSWNKKLSFVVPGVDLKGYGLTGTVDNLQPATSYACPFAAGILANLIGHFKTNHQPFKASEFINKLVFDIAPEDAPLKYGKGIINPIESFKNLMQ
ncbi:MAG: S8/S53 family peptidase [Ferruginibacter sp.]